jgi:hypothetical protein
VLGQQTGKDFTESRIVDVPSNWIQELPVSLSIKGYKDFTIERKSVPRKPVRNIYPTIHYKELYLRSYS